MTVRLLINDITFLRRIVKIHTDDSLLIFDGEEAIAKITPGILDSEINAYITKIEKGTMYLDIYI
jgi:hypothetical protein